jgi:hypothetical protein
MASLDELLPSVLANLALQGDLQAEDAGVAKQRLLRNYGERQLPSLVSYYASRGTFRSGNARLKADQLRQDVGDEAGDIDRLLARQMANLARQRILATAGVFV